MILQIAPDQLFFWQNRSFFTFGCQGKSIFLSTVLRDLETGRNWPAISFFLKSEHLLSINKFLLSVMGWLRKLKLKDKQTVLVNISPLIHLLCLTLNRIVFVNLPRLRQTNGDPYLNRKDRYHIFIQSDLCMLAGTWHGLAGCLSQSICLIKFASNFLLHACTSDYVSWNERYFVLASIRKLMDNDWYWTLIMPWDISYLDYQESFHMVRFWLMIRMHC